MEFGILIIILENTGNPEKNLYVPIPHRSFVRFIALHVRARNIVNGDNLKQ